jgi:predicted RNA-binding Zn ribbon-like protein
MSHSAPRPDAFFIADHRALDFLNSVATPQDERIDWLADGPSLLAWLRQGFGDAAGLVVNSKELDAIAARARTLREWFRGFVARHAGTKLTPAVARALKPLNELLANDQCYQQIVSGDGDEPLVLRSSHRPNAPNAALQPVAHAIADLVCHADFTQVRQCEGTGCTLWFLDVSKGHKRRWCSMAVCGNRAKVEQYRARQRGQS